MCVYLSSAPGVIRCWWTDTAASCEISVCQTTHCAGMSITATLSHLCMDFFDIFQAVECFCVTLWCIQVYIFNIREPIDSSCAALLLMEHACDLRPTCNISLKGPRSKKMKTLSNKTYLINYLIVWLWYEWILPLLSLFPGLFCKRELDLSKSIWIDKA